MEKKKLILYMFLIILITWIYEILCHENSIYIIFIARFILAYPVTWIIVIIKTILF